MGRFGPVQPRFGPVLGGSPPRLGPLRGGFGGRPGAEDRVLGEATTGRAQPQSWRPGLEPEPIFFVTCLLASSFYGERGVVIIIHTYDYKAYTHLSIQTLEPYPTLPYPTPVWPCPSPFYV